MTTKDSQEEEMKTENEYGFTYMSFPGKMHTKTKSEHPGLSRPALSNRTLSKSKNIKPEVKSKTAFCFQPVLERKNSEESELSKKLKLKVKERVPTQESKENCSMLLSKQSSIQIVPVKGSFTKENQKPLLKLTFSDLLNSQATPDQTISNIPDSKHSKSPQTKRSHHLSSQSTCSQLIHQIAKPPLHKQTQSLNKALLVKNKQNHKSKLNAFITFEKFFQVQGSLRD